MLVNSTFKRWGILLLLLLSTTFTYAQRKITGTVTTENSQPASGATVSITGTQVATQTDVSGIFSINVPQDKNTLTITYVGYEPQTVNVTNQTSIDITLKSSNAALEQVVVVGYGTQKRSDVTGAIGSVSAKQIEDEPVVQVGQALQGKVAGLQISQNSGTPGSPLLIRVRGTGTVNNASPLYVVDGNPSSDALDLAPDQIESIQVLKSASAAAIYGAQGANGVILITTKQGRAGKTQTDVNFSQGWQMPIRHYPVANATEYAILYNEGLVNAGQAPLFPDPQSLGEGTDWQKEIFRVAPMTDLSVSIRGGSETSKFYFSTGYVKQEGIVKGSSFDRINLRINSSHNLSSAIRVGQNLSLSMANYELLPEFNRGSILDQALVANPGVPLKMPDGNWGYVASSLSSTNPAAAIHYNHNDTKRPVANGNVYADVTLLKDFVFRSQFNFNMGYSSNTIFLPTFRISTRSYRDIASLTEMTNRFTDYAWSNTLTYQKSIGDHSFDLLGGTTVQESHFQSITATGAGLPLSATDDPNLRDLNLATQGNSVAGGSGEWGILSFLGRVNYNYKGKYFTTVNFRADGSSRFGANNKFGYFPSFSVGWKISQESFLKGAEWMNNLMLRGGWGSLGNQGSLPNYAFTGTVTPFVNYTFGEAQAVANGQAPTGVGNPDLKWEATKETNLGLDFTGFGNKVTASLDWYNKKTTDVLLQVPLAGYSGIEQFPYVNGGSVLNKGLEFMLGYTNKTAGGLDYSFSGNIAYNSNKVLALSNAGGAIFTRIRFQGLVGVTQVGSPIASFYGWKTDGIFQNQADISKSAFQSAGTAPGDWKFVDLNNDGVINALDQTIIGDPWPKFTYGFNSSFAYKGFDLKLTLQGVYGNEIFFASKYHLESTSYHNYDRFILENRWTGPGTSNIAPRMNASDPNVNMRSSDFYVKDGSYLRVKNIQLGYKVPQSLVHIRSLKVYASIANALTFTKYPGFDPEIGTNRENNPFYVGIDESNYPVARTYTIGFNMGF